MKIGIMQPYFFPYLGYFGLIKNTDKFILFDTVQFINHGWIERNRVLNQNGGYVYIQVPLRKVNNSKTKIMDIEIRNEENWQKKILAQLVHYKRKAPFYTTTIDLLENIFEIKTSSITELNFNLLEQVCYYLEIPFNCEIFSIMNLEIEKVNVPDDWALNICKKLGYKKYLNPIGGQSFFDKTKYDNNGIELLFYKQTLNYYSQRIGVENFIEGLSIIDVMMFNSPEEIRKMLDDYELI